MKAPFAAFAILLAQASLAQAHRLDAEAFVRPLGLIQVESWFETGEPADQARVEVFRGESLLLAGRMGKEGTFLFRYTDVAPLRVVVNAGAGHKAEVKISAEQLLRGGVTTAGFILAASPLLTAPLLTPPAAAELPTVAPLANRAPRTSLTGLLVGAGILLAIAAGGMIVARSRASGGRKPL